MLEAAEQISPQQHSIQSVEDTVRGAIEIPLHRERVLLQTPVAAKSRLALGPAIARARAIGLLHRAAVKAKTINAEGAILAGAAAVAGIAEFLLIAPAAIDVRAFGQVGRPRDDVDDAIHGICAPQRRADATDDLNTVYVLQHDVQRVRVDT